MDGMNVKEVTVVVVAFLLFSTSTTFFIRSQLGSKLLLLLSSVLPPFVSGRLARVFERDCCSARRSCLQLSLSLSVHLTYPLHATYISKRSIRRLLVRRLALLRFLVSVLPFCRHCIYTLVESKQVGSHGELSRSPVFFAADTCGVFKCPEESSRECLFEWHSLDSWFSVREPALFPAEESRFVSSFVSDEARLPRALLTVPCVCASE